MTKWRRLAAALGQYEDRYQAANGALRFAADAMALAKYMDRQAEFSYRQGLLNEQLVFVGLYVTDAGKVGRRQQSATTIDEATRHASSLRGELARRDTHPQVLAWCSVEVLKRDAFHAVAEAFKGVMQRLRDATGVDGDGARVIDDTLSPGQANMPMLAVNSLATVTERDEQKDS